MLKAKNGICVVRYAWKKRPDGSIDEIPVMGLCVEIEDDETHEKFIFEKSSVIRDIDRFDDTKNIEATIGTEEECWGYNLKPDEFHAKVKELRDFVSNLTTNDMIKIVDCMPRNKNGTARKATASVVISGITDYDGDPGYWCSITSAELCMSYLHNGEFRFVFDPRRDTKTKRQAIVDENGNYNKLVFKANSYLKPDDLIPGRIYADAKDREFLYVGKTATKYEDLDEHGNVVFGYQCEQFPFTFIPINDKKRREIMESETFEEWAKKAKKFSRKETFSMKVVAETGIGFKPEKLAGSADLYTKEEYNGGKYTRHCRFRVYGVPAKCCYVVCKKSTKTYSSMYTANIETPVYTCETEADATAKIKELKKKHPGTKYSKKAWYCFGDDKVIAGTGTTMPDLTDWRNRRVNCKMADLLVNNGGTV